MALWIFLENTFMLFHLTMISWFDNLSSMLRRWKNRLQCSNKSNTHQIYLSMDNELRNVYNKLEKLTNENNLLRIRFDKLQDRYEHWINDEQIYLMQRIEKLENENHHLHDTYQTYQMQNEKCIRSMTNLILKLLLNQKEPQKPHREQQNESQSNKKQSRNRSASYTSCQFVSERSDDSQYTTNDESIWPHQQLMIVEDQDQKTTNQSSELNNQSSTLASVKSKSHKSSNTLTNKLYFVLNNEKSTADNDQSKSVKIVPVDNSHISSSKQRSSTITMSLNKNRTNRQQNNNNPVYSNHERLSTQTSSITKNTSAKITTAVSKPSRIPTTKTRLPPPPTPTTTSSSTIRPRLPMPSVTSVKPISSSITPHKSPRSRITPVKSSESTTSSKPTITVTKITTTNNSNKTHRTNVDKSRTRISDFDTLQNEQKKKSTVVLPSPIINNVQTSLFSKDTVRRVRPVRSNELKLFSCHLTSDESSRADQSLLTLTPCSLESIKDDNKPIDNQSSCKIPTIVREFSEDSLNEHDHIQKLLQNNVPNNTKTTETDVSMNNESIQEGYFLSVNDNSDHSHRSTLQSAKPFVHRLIFPTRLGRVVFFRRILSDTDIYQKICSKDNEIYHNVYHLDSVRDFSMEFYMLATYTSDSQLRAWIDEDDDEVVNNVCHLDEDDTSENQMKTDPSRDSLNQQDEELDWCSEIELANLSLTNQQETYENTSSCCSEIHPNELLGVEQFSLSSLTTITSDSNSHSSTLAKDISNRIPIASNMIDESNLLLREILHQASYTLHSSSSLNTAGPQATNEQYENDLPAPIINDEFQTDFYYLCPVTNTTNFSKTDYKPLYHDF